MTEYIKQQQILIFEINEDIAGFGIYSRVIADRPEFDIGMLVNPRYRGQGLGEYIVGYLVHFCEQRNWRPICGCAIDNTASRRCLEKAGFLAEYRMLEFTF